jgi:type II secretory pathway predicted ATPase ExeA
MFLFDTTEFTPGPNASPGEITEALVKVAREIRMWQESQQPEIKDTAMLRRFPALGSSKTYKKLREGDTKQLVVEDWLPAYLGVLQMIQAEVEARAEQVYDDMTATSLVYQNTLRLIQQRGLNRLLVIEGKSGHGKSQALKRTAARLPGSIILVEADESWSSEYEAVGALCQATGAVKSRKELPKYFGDRQALLIDRLKNRAIIFIDEGHHMSGPVLNLLKHLINKTECCLAIAAMATLWDKLTREYKQEALQLLHNRLFARIRLEGPSLEDVRRFIDRRLKPAKGAGITEACKALQKTAADYGGFAFLRNVEARCRELGEEAVDAETLLEAAAHVKRQVEGR